MGFLVCGVFSVGIKTAFQEVSGAAFSSFVFFLLQFDLHSDFDIV